MNNNPNHEENLINSLMNRYLPYWPVFAISLVIFVSGAYVYLRFATPIYEAYATLIIKDEKKGVDDTRIMESMNAFGSKKIVENEIEVIQSRGLMENVVKDLDLYAPIYEDKGIKSSLAYTSSPVTIQLKNPENIDQKLPKKRYYFSFDSLNQQIKLDNTVHPLEKWVRTPFGEAKFSPNDNQSSYTNGRLYFNLINPKQATLNLLSGLQALPANKQSTIVYLKYKDPIPKRAEDILNRLIFTYNESAIIERNNLASNTLAFFEERLVKAEKELFDLEKEVQDYKSQYGIVDLEEQGRLYLQNVGQNDRDIARIQNQLAVLEEVEKNVTSTDLISGIVPSTLGVTDPVLTQLLEKLYSFEVEYEKLRQTTAENNPVINSLTDQIRKTRPYIVENINNHKINLRVSLQNLKSNNQRFDASLKTIPEQERELLELNRKRIIKNELFRFLLQKREEAALTYAPNAGESKIVDMAQSSLEPVNPKPAIIFPLSIFLAFALVIGCLEVKEVLSNRILYRQEVEDVTNEIVIGEIPQVNRMKGSILNINSNKIISQHFRNLRVAIGLYGQATHQRKILVTSSIKGEGKSFVSENIGLSLASSGKKVVLINFDLRKPTSGKIFNAPGEKGMSDYLAGGLNPYEIIKSTENRNLFIIPSGNTVEESHKILLDLELGQLFTYLESEFEFIIIDTPPLQIASDAYILSKYCDTTIYVVRHRHTPKEILKRINQKTHTKKLKNLMLVFNGVKVRGYAKTGYGYGYDYNYK